nr:hypothetical protein [Defluviicoccus vanus]
MLRGQDLTVIQSGMAHDQRSGTDTAAKPSEELAVGRVAEEATDTTKMGVAAYAVTHAQAMVTTTEQCQERSCRDSEPIMGEDVGG